MNDEMKRQTLTIEALWHLLTARRLIIKLSEEIRTVDRLEELEECLSKSETIIANEMREEAIN